MFDSECELSETARRKQESEQNIKPLTAIACNGLRCSGKRLRGEVLGSGKEVKNLFLFCVYVSECLFTSSLASGKRNADKVYEWNLKKRKMKKR